MARFFDINNHEDVLEFQSALEDRIESERERDGEALFRKIAFRKEKRVLYGTEKYRPVKEMRSLVAKGKEPCSPPNRHSENLENISWNMKEYKCAMELCCEEAEIADLIYSDKGDLFMDDAQESIDNAGDLALYNEMLDPNKNTIVDFQAGVPGLITGAGGTLDQPATMFDRFLLELRKNIIHFDWMFISPDVFCGAQLSSNVKEISGGTQFLGTGAVQMDRVRAHLSGLLGISPEQIYTDDTAILTGDDAIDDVRRTYLANGFMYFGKNKKIRLYENKCSRVTTTDTYHDQLEVWYKETWDVKATDDKNAGVLVNNLVAAP